MVQEGQAKVERRAGMQHKTFHHKQSPTWVLKQATRISLRRKHTAGMKEEELDRVITPPLRPVQQMME